VRTQRGKALGFFGFIFFFGTVTWAQSYDAFNTERAKRDQALMLTLGTWQEQTSLQELSGGLRRNNRNLKPFIK